MADALASLLATPKRSEAGMTDKELVAMFDHDPETAYGLLLDRYTPVLLRMIRRFMRDPDEVMEVYTSICERLRAHDFQALRRFHVDSELTPWLAVVAANACRDRFRKTRTTSSPQSVIDQLDERERLVFKYYYQDHLPHEDIAETVSSQHGIETTALDVLRSIEKINELLTVKKRWMLLAALQSNLPPLSIDELSETGYQPPDRGSATALEDTDEGQALLSRLEGALQTIDPEDQLLVMLRFEQGMTAVQIAEVMHYENHKYVYTRLRTIAGRLRRILEAG